MAKKKTRPPDHLGNLYKAIGSAHTTEKDRDWDTLEDLEITKKKIQRIHEWAEGRTTYGKLATYIPELSKQDPNKSAVAIGDLHGNKITAGDGSEVVASIQSVVKPFLYLYALHKGKVRAERIAGMEATAMPFKADKVLHAELEDIETAEHPLNNAGGISSSGEVYDFNDFLKFMRTLTGNKKLRVLEDVFKSEMNENGRNRAISYMLESRERFKNVDPTDKVAMKNVMKEVEKLMQDPESMKRAEAAVKNYTRACSIGVTSKDLLKACLVLASGGIDVHTGKRLTKMDHATRTISAMNSFGMYEQTGAIALLAAGGRANTCKSGVGGYVVNINPSVGAFVTYSPLLNSSGNSVYGLHAMIPLNRVLAAPGAMILSPDEAERTLEEMNTKDSKKVHEEILKLMRAKADPRIWRADPTVLKQLRNERARDIKLLDARLNGPKKRKRRPGRK